MGTPKLVRDLPAGGKRFLQRATGYRATLVHGEVLPGAKHSPPTTEAFREWLGEKLTTFFRGA